MNIEDQITILKELGDGSFAITYLVQNKQGELLTMKAIDIEKSAQQRLDINFITNEINTLIALSSPPSHVPYIIRYQGYLCGYLYDRDIVAIFSDYVEGTILDRYILELAKKPKFFNRIINCLFCKRNLNTPLTSDKLIKYMQQLLIALVHVHRTGYAHRDIKPENIIYDTKNNQMVLIDFGLACSEQCFDIMGSPLWMSPELFSSTPPRSLKSAQAHDIWSLGIVFYELANLKLPFDDTDVKDRLELGKMLSGKFKPSHYKNDKINLMIDQMLNKNWRCRPTASSLLKYISAE